MDEEFEYVRQSNLNFVESKRRVFQELAAKRNTVQFLKIKSE